MNFYIKHKESGLFFAGFNQGQECVWGDVNSSKPFETKLLAQGQASLLICNGENVFKKVYANV